MNVLSLGGGVQSSTMALMATRGEIEPMPDCAIFADTGAEPEAVYRWLARLAAELSFPVEVVSAGSLLHDSIAGVNRQRRAFTQVPWHMERGMGARQCTKNYKIAPLYRRMRVLGARTASLWIGISTDEAHRCKAARVQWVTNRWPLIEQRLSRNDCLAWLDKHGYPAPPKSACVFCPYADDDFFSALSAADMRMAISVDNALRADGTRRWFVHRSHKPLANVDFSNHGQMDLWGEECEGMCGV